MKLAAAVFLCLCPFTTSLCAQQPSVPLTNARIGNLIAAGLSVAEIVQIISSAPKVDFDLRPASTDNLLKAGVSEEIIKAMAAREQGVASQGSKESKGQWTIAPFGPPGDSDKTRVFVSDSSSLETSGGVVASSGSAASHASGAARPLIVEVIKSFGQRCSTLLVTMDKTKADYVVLFDHDGGKGLARRRDKIAVFKKDGDVLFSEATRSVGTAVDDSCNAIEADLANTR